MKQNNSLRCLFVLQVVVLLLAAASAIVHAEAQPQIHDEGQEEGHTYGSVPTSPGHVEMNIDPTTGDQQPTTIVSSLREGPDDAITAATDDDDDGENDDDDYYDEDGDDDDDEEEEIDFYHYPWDDFPYYREEFDDEPRWPPTCNPSEGVVEECEDPKDFVLDEFIVAGKNIAEYGQPPKPKVFELYEDFDISSMIQGDEGWKDLLYIRRSLERPSLSWYVDKVARKKWLTARGYPQPEIYFMKYKYELLADSQYGGGSSSSSSSVRSPPNNDTSQDEFKQLLTEEIQKNLPTEHSFAAKPTHTSMAMGLWLVDHTPIASVENGHVKQQIHTSFTQHGMRLYSSDDDERFGWDPQACAGSLAEGLFRKPAGIESWALHNVHPGVVVEELLSFQEDPSLPPQELCFFVIWGRVYVAQWNYVMPTGRHMYGFYYRSGRRAPDFLHNSPSFIDLESVPWWDEMITVAESLGQHKDFLRVDFLVGVSKEEWKRFDRAHQLRDQIIEMREESGDEDVRVPPPPDYPPIKMIVSECEIFPTTMFTSPFIADEAARLWLAGYKSGNFKVIPNNEVPPQYVHEHQKISQQWEQQEQ